MRAMIVVLLAGMLTSGCATYNELSSIRRYEERVAREVYETDGEAALDNAYTVRPTRGGQGVETCGSDREGPALHWRDGDCGGRGDGRGCAWLV